MQNEQQRTYADVGIDISETDAVKHNIAKTMATDNNRVLNSANAFASLYDFRFDEYDHPVMVMKTEEPGSKQKLAFQYDRIETLAQDMIHHLINDIIVMGAKPLVVQDAIIAGKLEHEVINRLIQSMVSACIAQECVLTGGETSIQPGVIDEGMYILTSSIVGLVDKQKVVDGSAIKQGDLVLGIASNGLHTNGYTFIRSLMEDDPGLSAVSVGKETFLDVVMRPHLCYYQALKDLLEIKGLHGMAHITGGGIEGNVGRILPSHLNAAISPESIPVPEIFSVIQTRGRMDSKEMFRTFNMGVGMVLVIQPEIVMFVQEHLLRFDHPSYIIGKIVSGEGEVIMGGMVK